jgi:hypothetical protein
VVVWCPVVVTSYLSCAAVVFDASTSKGSPIVLENGRLLKAGSGNVCCALSMPFSRTDHVRCRGAVVAFSLSHLS